MLDIIAEIQQPFATPSAALNRFTDSTGTSSTDSSAESAGPRYGFRIGNIGLLIASMTTMEVLEPMPVYPIPNTVGWLKGLINLRGSLVPIIDLGTLFGETDDQHARALVLVLGKGDDAVGIPIVQHPQSLAGLNKLDQLPPVPGELKNQVANAYIKNGKVWFEFNHQSFFKSNMPKIAVRN